MQLCWKYTYKNPELHHARSTVVMLHLHWMTVWKTITELTYNIPMLDEVIADLSGRFSHHCHSFVLTKLLPCNIVQSVWADIQPAISKYASLLDLSLTVIKAEYTLWQQHWRDDKQSVALLPANALDSLNHCSAKSNPNMHLLLKVLATLPVSTATPERVFSKLERTLTALRSTMTEDIGLRHWY